MDNSNYEGNQPAQQTPGKAIACLILGICSIVFSCSGIVGLVCGIIDLVLSKKLVSEVAELPGQAKVGKTLGIIGLIISIIGILVWVVWFILMMAGLAATTMDYM